jgi:large subunit ribosomal protein L31
MAGQVYRQARALSNLGTAGGLSGSACRGYIYSLSPTLLRKDDITVKAGIHPEYHPLTVVCACGNSWTTRSTAKSIHLEICAKCHPYFTGKQKRVDTAGRVERFRAKYRTSSDS